MPAVRINTEQILFSQQLLKVGGLTRLFLLPSTLTQLCPAHSHTLISLHSEPQSIVCVCVSVCVWKCVCMQWCESRCGQKVSYRMQPFWLTQCVLLSPTYWTGRLHYPQCWHHTNNLPSLSSSSAILQFLHDDRQRVLRKNRTKSVSHVCFKLFIDMWFKLHERPWDSRRGSALNYMQGILGFFFPFYIEDPDISISVSTCRFFIWA